MTTNKLENLLALLSIRRAARRRDTIFIGGVFLVSFLATISLGILDQLNGRSIYLVTALVVVFGLSYLMAWVRLQIIIGSIELIDTLHLAKE